MKTLIERISFPVSALSTSFQRQPQRALYLVSLRAIQLPALR